MNIVTVWWGDKYSEDYPKALRNQLAEFGHSLIILGNHENMDRPLIEPDKYTGWWSKMEVFSPRNEDIRPCLFLDLDTFVLKSLEPLLSLKDYCLWLITDFNRPNHANSGHFIAPKNGVSDFIWRKAEISDRRGGDGDFLNLFPHQRMQNVVPGIKSYKSDKLQNEFPKNAMTVSFHGKPKPHETTGWAKEWWDAHTR